MGGGGNRFFKYHRDHTDSVDITLQWLSFSESFSVDFRRLSFWARSCWTLPCKWRNSRAVLVSSPGLGLGVVELRLVPTPLSGGEDVPFTMGLPAGVWVKNKIRIDIRVSDITRSTDWQNICASFSVYGNSENGKLLSTKMKDFHLQQPLPAWVLFPDGL